MNLPAWVERHADLSSRNTLALPGRAALYADITDAAQLALLREHPMLARTRRFVLGGGSNLVLDGDFDGLVLHVANRGRRLVAEDADAWYVNAAGGESWHPFVLWTLENGWGGLENLVLIPGTVGASPVQNIGAYGLELADRFHSLTAFDMATGAAVRFERNDCRFAYRDSVFKRDGQHLEGRYVITDVTFRLPKNWLPITRYGDVAAELDARKTKAPSPQQVAEAVIAIRQRKLPDPELLPNAGSFFQNPIVDAESARNLFALHPRMPHYPQADGRVKLAAGWLIEQAGWKGRSLGPVGMYEKQALVLVNQGDATGTDVRRAMEAVRAEVSKRFGVQLVPEPVFL